MDSWISINYDDTMIIMQWKGGGIIYNYYALFVNDELMVNGPMVG